MRIGAKYFQQRNRFTPTAKLGLSIRYVFGRTIVEETNVLGQVLSSVDLPDSFFPGIHAAIGSEYSLQNGGALSLYFTFDYSQKPAFLRLPRPLLLANSLTSFGLRLGYIF